MQSYDAEAAVVGHQLLAVRAELSPSPPEIAPVRSRQPDQLAVVIQPAHDHLTGALDDRVPLQGSIRAGVEDIAAVVLPALAEVNEPQGGYGLIADRGQLCPALGVAAQDPRSPMETVQALEPLAAQPVRWSAAPSEISDWPNAICA
jgi:hypothetical protein